MKIVQAPSPNFSSRGVWIPDMVVCHIAEGTYSGTLAWFANKSSQVSSHFLVAKNGEVAQCVDLKMAAWCNGTSVGQTSTDSRSYTHSTLDIVRSRKTNANNYTISIEFEGHWSESQGALTAPQLESAVNLLRYISSSIKSIFGISIPIDRQHVVGHCEVNPITKPNCPGANFPFEQLIASAKKSSNTTYCVKIPNVSTYGECQSIQQWVQREAPYNVLIEEA